MLVERALEVGEVRDVTAYPRHTLGRVCLHRQAEAVVVVAEVERDDGDLALHELAHDPGADAAVGAGDEDAWVRGLGHRGTVPERQRPRCSPSSRLGARIEGSEPILRIGVEPLAE